ncbi:MAG: hypothetical protein ABEJ64_00700 [Candidatus Nanohaloarchaea archaeon]
MASRRIDPDILPYLVHEVREPMALVSGIIDAMNAGLETRAAEEFEEEYEGPERERLVSELKEDVDFAISLTSALTEQRGRLEARGREDEVDRFLYEEDIERLRKPAEEIDTALEERVARSGYALAGLWDYQERLDGEQPGPLSMQDVLEPLEARGEVTYNGAEEELVNGGRDLWLGPTTWLKNLDDHTEGAETGAAVRPADGDVYEILIWDTGTGIDEGAIDEESNGFRIAEDVTTAYDGEFEVLYNRFADGSRNPEWEEAAGYLSGELDRPADDLGSIFSWKLRPAGGY